ncbi:MAG: methionyl-tRNA formyltransferase [Bacteroidales bacterium]|nr:methionyl-tRNA formyltransferase [Bacteroidales bacterium]
MRILFVGCVKSSSVLLQSLLENDKMVVGVVTKKESPYNSDFCDLKPLCVKYGIEPFYTQSINDKATKVFIDTVKPDIIYCFGWSELIDQEVISKAPKGVVGFHPAALPNNKGRHPIIWALVLGLKKTASSFFMIDEKADNGAIISQQEVFINDEDNAGTLYNKVIAKAKVQVLDFTEAFEKDEVIYLDQPDGIGNSWRKRTKKDGKIDFRMSARSIYNLVRGLSKPYIGAHFEFQEKECKVWNTEIIVDDQEAYLNIEPGKVLEVYSKGSFLVKTGENLIKITDCDEISIKIGDYL